MLLKIISGENSHLFAYLRFVLLLGCVFAPFGALVLLVLLVHAKSFRKKKKKKKKGFKTVLMTSFILLPNSSYYKHEFF